MFFNISEQALLFLMSVVMGVFFGLLYEVFRISRIAFNLSKLAIAIEDFVFLMLCAIGVFAFSIEYGNGMIRLFFVIGALLGAILYLLTVGRLIFAASRGIIFAIKSFFSFIYRILIHPIIRFIVFLYQKLRSMFSHIGDFFKKICNKSKFDLKHNPKVLYNRYTCKKKARKGVSQNGSENKKGRKEKG